MKNRHHTEKTLFGFDYRKFIRAAKGTMGINAFTQKLAGEGEDNSMFKKVLNGQRNGSIECIAQMVTSCGYDMYIIIQPAHKVAHVGVHLFNEPQFAIDEND